MTTRFDPDQVTHPLHVAQQAAWAGVGSAVPGCIIGATYGTLRTRTPVLFSLTSGGFCFVLGSTFWGVRSAILNQAGLQNWWNRTRGRSLPPHSSSNSTLEHEHAPQDRVRASVIAGAFTGCSTGLLLRGPRNVIPGTLMFTLYGWVGQHAYNYLDQRNSDAVQKEMAMQEQGQRKPKFMQELAKSKWSPMKALSDEEYKDIMNEKVLSVEAEIALIDEKIETLRRQQQETEVKRINEVGQAEK